MTLNQRRCLNLAAALAFGPVSWTSPCAAQAADETVDATESEVAKETALGALLLQAGEAALQKKNVKVARKDLVKARKLLHAEKNIQLEARALTLLSQLEAAATNRRLSASYAAQAKLLEGELAGGTDAPNVDQAGSGAIGEATEATAMPTDAAASDATGNQRTPATVRTASYVDALPKTLEIADAGRDAVTDVIIASIPNLDAAGTADVEPAVTDTPLEDPSNGPHLPTAIAIMFGVWGLVSSLLTLRQNRRR